MFAADSESVHISTMNDVCMYCQFVNTQHTSIDSSFVLFVSLGMITKKWEEATLSQNVDKCSSPNGNGSYKTAVFFPLAVTRQLSIASKRWIQISGNMNFWYEWCMHVQWVVEELGQQDSLTATYAEIQSCTCIKIMIIHRECMSYLNRIDKSPFH